MGPNSQLGSVVLDTANTSGKNQRPEGVVSVGCDGLVLKSQGKSGLSVLKSHPPPTPPALGESSFGGPMALLWLLKRFVRALLLLNGLERALLSLFNVL